MPDLHPAQTQPAPDRARRPRRMSAWHLVSIGLVLFIANLGALVDAVLHPEIGYFDPEHWIVGAISALVVGTALLFIRRHIKRVEHVLQAARQTEDALRESEQRLRAIIDHAPFGAHLYELMPDQRLVFRGSNPAADLILGIDHRAFIGLTIEAAFPRLGQTNVPAIYRQTAATGERYDIDRVDYAAGHLQGAFEVHAFQTGPNRMAALFRDITERKRTEEQLRRYEFIANAATELMTLINQQHVLEAANDAYCRAQGKPRPELIGRSLADIWGEARYREKILPYLQRCFAGESVHYEDTFAICGSEPRHFQVGMYPYLAAADGPVMYAAIVTVDVTERVQAEAALRDLNVTLNRRLTEQLALLKATAAISSSLNIGTILHQVAAHMGTALDVTSTYICDWEPAAGRATVVAEWLSSEAVEAEQQGSVGESYDLIAEFGDDLDKWLLSGQPFISQVDDPQLYEPARQHMIKWGGRSALTVPLFIKGRSIGYVDLWESRRKRQFKPEEIILAQAIAQQAAVAMENARLYEQVNRHAEELEARVADRTRQLAEANAQLAELDRLKDEFISRISHELRTPLTSIKIYLELLAAGKPEKRQKYMQVLNEQTARLQQLIESLLEVTRQRPAPDELTLTAVDLNHLAQTLAADAGPRAAQRGLTLTMQLAPALPPVKGDAVLLAQVLSNLMKNALSYTPAGGAIEIITAPISEGDTHWLTLTVRDTGPGISADELPHIFDRFYRGRAAADYKTPGAGVGLSISRDIMISLGGRLTVKSEPGAGAAFTIWLCPA